MKVKQKNLYKIFTLGLGLAIALGSLLWLQGSGSPALAQEPGDDLALQVLVISEGVSAADVGTVPVFNVGDRFNISIVAQGVPDPGIFGSQFEVIFDTEHLTAVDGSLVSGAAMEPVVIAVQNFDLAGGVVSWAASRQGDLADVPGDVVLASLTLEAISPTEPPEGQTTRIGLQNVKLGRKGGIEVEVAGLVPLDIIIRDDGTIPGQGDINGNVTVQGRAADNQAGHTVTAVGSAATVSDDTDENGDFLINNAPADTYDVTAERPGFLAAVCTGVAHAADALTTLNDVVLLAGDIDGSREIDITDAVAIGAVFGSTAPGEIADLNDDGIVDILDLILMAANFGQTTAGNPWACQ